MPLVEATLEQAIKSKIKAIETKLQKSLDDQSLGIYSALKEIDSKMKNTLTGFNINTVKNEQWTLISSEWSKALAKQITETLANELSTIIATEVDKYIKTASIILPPGQVLAAGTYTGATTAPSPPAIIS